MKTLLSILLILPFLARAEAVPATIQITAEEVEAYRAESPSFAKCVDHLLLRGVDKANLITFMRLPNDRDRRKETQFHIEGLDQQDRPVRICLYWMASTRRYDCSMPQVVEGAAERATCFRP